MYIPASNRVNIMKRLEIEIGDTVRIAESSVHYNTTRRSNPRCDGIVQEICSHIDVDWENNTSNTYQSSDLILIKKGKTMQFTKSDLKTGMFVKQRDGMFMLVLEKAAVGRTCFTNLADVKENLLSGYAHLDIVAVYEALYGGIVNDYMRGEDLTLIWERTEQTEAQQTEAQKEMEVLQAKMDELQEQMKVVKAKI
jgi:hypothetical protein